MNQEIKDRWVQALRSGEYRQGKGHLRRTEAAGNGYCCLGVLCDLAAQDGIGHWEGDEEEYSPAYVFRDNPDPEHEPFTDRSQSVLTRRVVAWAELHDGNPDVAGDFQIDGQPQTRATLAAINDNDGDFTQIADLIDQQL